MTDDTIEQCLERIRSAWDAGDAGAYAREFTEDATYVIFLGDPMIGRDEIERTHAPVFTRWQKGTRMALRPVEIRSLGPDVAVALTIGGIGKGRQIKFDKLQTYTLVRRDGRWSCSAFQNTEMSRRSRRRFNA